MVIWRKARAHHVRPDGPRSGWRKGLVALAALLPVVSVLAVTAPASAHANKVTGVASCQANGTYTVTWTVANDYPKTVDVTLVGSPVGGGTITGLPTTIGVSPATATVTQSGIAGNVTTASLTVKGVWSDKYSQSDTGTVWLSGNCRPSHTPAVPTATQPTCTVLTGTIHIPTDTGVTYKVDGTTKTGDVTGLSLGVAHTVVASSTTLNLTDPKSWSFTFVKTTADCRTRIDIPAEPKPTAPTCSTNGSLTLVNGDHYTWADSKQPSDPGTHHVTATAADGFVFTNGKTTVSYDVEVLGATNDCAVELVAPTVVQPQCTGPGTSSSGSITPNTSAHVTYVLNGTVVTATTQAPYKFSATTGWVIAGNGLTATYTVTLVPAGDCLTVVVPVVPDVTQPKCDGPGTHTDLVITPADTVGITYSVNGNVVTATPKTGYKLGSLTGGWVAGPNGTATFTVTVVDPGPCLVTVVPVAPTVEPSICTGPGTASDPVITPVPTAHITYTVKGNVVTATPDQGYALGASQGWTIDPETGVGTYTVDLVIPDCTVTVQVVDPKITTSQECGVAATFTIPTTTGVVYLLNGEVIEAGTYSTPSTGTITAKAATGYALGNSEWSFDLKLPATVACPTVVTPVGPTVDSSTTCGVEGSYTIPATEGIVYLLDGVVVTAGSHDGPASGTITAQAKDGFTLANADWSVALDLPAAGPCNIPNTGGGSKLPQTGGQTGWLVGGGAAALLAGLLLVVAGRRREDTIG